MRTHPTIKAAALFSMLAVSPAHAQDGTSGTAIGQRIYDLCNPLMSEPELANTPSFDQKLVDCMTLTYDETLAYAARAKAVLSANDILDPQITDHCDIATLLDTTQIKDPFNNLKHNTDVTNDCLFSIFEAKEKYSSLGAVFDAQAHWSLQNATNCLAEFVGKWRGSCKKTNDSRNTPFPFGRHSI